MMGRKQVLKTAAEYDFIFDRGGYCYLANRPSAKRTIKRQLNKRYRRDLNNDLKRELVEVKL